MYFSIHEGFHGRYTVDTGLSITVNKDIGLSITDNVDTTVVCQLRTIDAALPIIMEDVDTGLSSINVDRGREST